MSGWSSVRQCSPPEQLLADEPLLLLVVNNRGFYRKMGEDKETYKLLLVILKTYRRLKVAVVFADVDNQTPSYSGPDIFKQIKETDKHIDIHAVIYVEQKG